jgi:LysM repeat protein
MSRGRRYGIILVILAFLSFPAAAFSAPVEQSGASYYVVRPGDTLADIAIKLGVSSSVLAKANGITDPDFIYVGQRLLVPGQGATATPETPAPTPVQATAVVAATPTGVAATPTPGAATAGGAPTVYTVRSGDTLNKIAARFGMTVKAIMAANGLTNPDFIYVGERLVLGGGTGSSQPTPAPQATATPAAQVAATPKATPRAVATPAPPKTAYPGKWIDVNLSKQRLIAYEGAKPVLSVLISSGTAAHPTVVGKFAVNTKIRSQTMTGPGYRLPNVPWVMYFYQDYAIHGTYWHHNYGHPMSHGCVNATIADAAWLYTWASIGTPVITHW